MEFSEKEKEQIKAIAKEIVKEITNEVEKAEDKKERIKILGKLEDIADVIDKKSEKVLENDELCTVENLEKLYNLYKQQEDFFDSVLRKANK